MKQPFVEFFTLVQKVGAGGIGLPILRELSYSIFFKS